MDAADRAAEPQERLNSSAAAARRIPAGQRGHPWCWGCACRNDRPQYTLCSECVADPSITEQSAGTQRTCNGCRHFTANPHNPEAGIGACARGLRKVQTTRGPNVLRPTVAHLCHAWQAPA